MHREESAALSPVESDADDSSEPFLVHELQNLRIDGTYEGSSSGLAFADILREKIFAKLPSLVGLTGHLFETVNLTSSLPRYNFDDISSSTFSSLPPRVLADQLTESFFRDWHPLFPILHIPTFQADYQRIYSSSTLLGKEEFLVQLFLVFSIASRRMSSIASDPHATYERQWRKLLCTLDHLNSLTTLQSLILAQLDMCAIGQHSDLWQFKMNAVGIALRLGLNRPNKQSSSHQLSFLEKEMRSRAFWATFTLDVFSSASLGLPPILRQKDITCHYPSDVDDEFVSDKAVTCVAPGKATKVSAAIELARFARVLSHILTAIYCPSLASTRIYKSVFELGEELDNWRNNIAPHLRFDLASPVPSSELRQHPRAPCFAIAYHYARILIHRPAIAADDFSTRGTSSTIAMTESAKAIIGITSHLRLRDVKFTLCLNQAKLLLSCGLIVLYTAMDYPKDGKLIYESRNMMCKCLAGIYGDSGVTNAEYKEFESLSNALLGKSLEVKNDLSTVQAIAKLHGLADELNTIKRKNSDGDDQVASITIPHMPISEGQTPNELHHESTPTNASTSAISALCSNVNADVNILHWATTPKQQLYEYRHSSTHIANDVQTKDEPANDSEIENLFAMMDGMVREASSQTGRGSKRVKETATAFRRHSTIGSCQRRRSSISTTSSSRSSAASADAAVVMPESSKLPGTLLATSTVEDINRALSTNGSLKRRSLSLESQRKHRYKHRHNSFNASPVTVSSSASASPPLTRARPDPSALTAVALAAADGSEWNMWWDDLFTAGNKMMSVGNSTPSENIPESVSSLNMESGGSTAPSSAPSSVDLESEQAIQTQTDEQTQQTQTQYVYTPSKMMHADEVISPRDTNVTVAAADMLKDEEWSGLGWINSATSISTATSTPT